MTQEITVIPRSLRTYSATWASRPTTDLMTGDLFYATDRKVFYRWDGTSWNAQSIYSASGIASAKPAAADLPDGSLYYATDTYIISQVQGGAWVEITKQPLQYYTRETALTVTTSSGGTAAWEDGDFSALPDGSKAIHVVAATGSGKSAGVRKTGSAQNIFSNISTQDMTFVAELGANRHCELYHAASAATAYKVLGYWA